MTCSSSVVALSLALSSDVEVACCLQHTVHTQHVTLQSQSNSPTFQVNVYGVSTLATVAILIVIHTLITMTSMFYVQNFTQ